MKNVPVKSFFDAKKIDRQKTWIKELWFGNKTIVKVKHV
jgi:hypothetical protein